LVTIQEWLTIGGGAQDILDDVQLFNTVQSFLETQTEQYTMVKSSSSSSDDDDNNPIAVEQAWESLVETKRSLKLTFMSQTMRPTISRGFHNLRHQGNTTTTTTTTNRGAAARTRNISARDPPDLDRMAPEDFVDNLEGMASAAFSNVTQEVCVCVILPVIILLIIAYLYKGSLHHCRPARNTNIGSYGVVFISRRQLLRRISRDSDYILAHTGD
jgi:GTPase-activating protein BEM2